MKSKFRIGDRVKIWISTDESGRASYRYDIEPQLDWHVTEFYPEQIECEIIWQKALLLAQHVYTGYKSNPEGEIILQECRGKVYDISRNGINQRIEYTVAMLEHYGLNIDEWCQEAEMDSLEEFYKIELI